ncbi:MAG: hypothetical protein LBF78_07655 [Treponema sp.]|jgi:hypothetical protein|nr:hypothetical protein [Treponema sp.]
MACGIEDYPYIEPINESRISTESNYRATINMPGSMSSGNFTNYVIYYRIYVSNTTPELFPNADTKNKIGVINPTMLTDYAAIEPYTNIDSVSTSTNTLFTNRKFYTMALAGSQTMENVLDNSVFGQTLTFDFSQTGGVDIPTLTIGSGPPVINTNSFYLQRSNSNFTKVPSITASPITVPFFPFQNSEELSKKENLTTDINLDVANKSDIIEGDPHYTYVLMYIAAVGLNTQSYTQIYSIPTLIGIFLLPDA